MAVWMVRAGKQGIWEDIALEKNIAGTGWVRLPDIGSVKTRKEMFKLIKEHYPEYSTAKTSNATGQLFAMSQRIQKGDLVIMPLRNKSGFAIGEITGDYKFRTDLGPNVRHTRAVKWIKEEVPRTAFQQDLLYSLGAIMTVCQIKRNNAEERIRAFLKSGKDPGFTDLADNGESVSEDDESATQTDIEQLARDQIMRKIAESFQGHDFAKLVEEVLIAQGYITEFSPPGPDGGVDILAGKGPMGFEAPKLCVQVKATQSSVDVNVFRALQGTMINFKAEQGLLVSWGGFTKNVEREARQSFFNVRLWDADDFVEAIFKNYDKLSDNIKAELPLKRLWALVVEE